MLVVFIHNSITIYRKNIYILPQKEYTVFN